MYTNKFLFLTLLLLFYCGTTSVKEDEKWKVPEDSKEQYDSFFSDVPAEETVFQVFFSSGYYEKRQVNLSDIVEVRADIDGDKRASKELKDFDKVDFFGKALLKIELYPDTSTLSRVRFLRSSGISELDRIISEDITRWKFSFLVENTKEDDIPEQFIVEYGVLLKRKITRKEAVEELKKYVR